MCECERLNQHVTFVWRGEDDMTRHVVAMANPGIYVGSMTLPMPFGMSSEWERRLRVRDIHRVSRDTPGKLRFAGGVSKLIMTTGNKASVINLSMRLDEKGNYPTKELDDRSDNEGVMSEVSKRHLATCWTAHA